MDIGGIRNLLKRPLAGESRPRAGQNQRGLALDTAAVALRNDSAASSSIDAFVCPAPASALSDAAMSWFALARLTSRVDYAGSALLSGVVPLLRITSAATLACASVAGELFSERPIGSRSICDVAAHQVRRAE